MKSDIEKIQKEKFKFTDNFNRSIQLNLNSKDILNGILKGSAFDWFTGSPYPIGLIVGTVIPMINFSYQETKTFSSAKNNLKLAYLSKAKKRNFI